MRKAALIVGVILVAGLVGAWWYARPLLGIRELKMALMARDPQGVARRVDFPTLKVNAKHYRNRQVEQKNQGKFLEGLRDWIGKGLVDDAIDNAGTPEGLIRLVCDGKTDGLPTAPGTPCPLKGRLEDYGYSGDNSFTVVVRKADGKGLGMVMSQTPGASRWRLIHLFDAPPEQKR